MTNENTAPERNSGAAKYFAAEQAEDSAGGTGRASIVHQDDYPKYEIAQGVIFCPVAGSNLSLNFVTFPPNSGFPSHVHAEEQISIVREGEMEITIQGDTRIVRAGDVIIFPPNVSHAGRTFDRMCRLIDIFAPPRQGMDELIANANPVRSAEIDRWWREDR